MIVECSNCQTRFQLDDARVPRSGIRVRCSRCKEAFFLEHPDASEAEAVDDVAARAAEAERVPVEPTHDLDSDAGDSQFEAEEEDWEFNEDPPAEEGGDDSVSLDGDFDGDDDDDDGEADHVPGLGLDGLDGDESEAGGHDESSGLDLASGPASASSSPGEPDEVDFDAGDDASDFGEAEDFSALADDVDDLEDDAPALEVSSPTVTPSAQEPVGEPEDWDFFSDDSLEGPGALDPLERTMGETIAAIEADAPMRSAPQDGPALAPASRGSRSRLVVARVGHFVGWTITLGLFGLGIARGIVHVGAPHRAGPAVVDLGVVRVEGVRGTWIETLRESRLYSVRGRLVNVDREARMAGPGLQVALLSEDGSRLEARAAPAGVPLPDVLVRELPSSEIAGAQRNSVAALAATRLAPGEGAEFQAFFDAVPDSAASFLVETDRTPPVAPPRVSPPAYDALAPELDAGGLPDATASSSALPGPPRPTPGAPAPSPR